MKSDSDTITKPKNTLVGAGEDTMEYIKEKNKRDYGAYGFFEVVIRDSDSNVTHSAHASGFIRRLFKK